MYNGPKLVNDAKKYNKFFYLILVLIIIAIAYIYTQVIALKFEYDALPPVDGIFINVMHPTIAYSMSNL
ncbi:MAG: hypothetical protein BEN18_11430 [Epulopiscium sp. Nuni2H_MBin001]|nr:MAG: hypothetical protein BEN18_11430 [Epulopiscium sp. Nuni2H_MBin001]